MYQNHYYNQPQMYSSNTSTLTQVLTSYAPSAATVIYVDSKEKKSVRLSLVARKIIALLFCLVLIGGTASFYVKGGTPLEKVNESESGKSSVQQQPQNKTFNNQEQQRDFILQEPPVIITQERFYMNGKTQYLPMEKFKDPPRAQPQFHHNKNEPRVIYSFDDNDIDDEARVETV